MAISDEERTQEPFTRSSLCSGPSVPGHTIQQDEERSTWVIDQILLPCTPPEYGCLRVLLEQIDRRVTFTHFAASLPELFSVEETAHAVAPVRLRHLMSSLRNKVWSVGMDLVSVRGVGYMLLSRAPDSGDEQTH